MLNTARGGCECAILTLRFRLLELQVSCLEASQAFSLVISFIDVLPFYKRRAAESCVDEDTGGKVVSGFTG